MTVRRNTRRRTSKKSKRSVRTRRNSAAALKRSIAKSLRSLRTRGGGRMDAWQDKYPQYPGNSWATAPTVCQFPNMAEAAFKGPVQRGGGDGGYGLSETFFGRRPVGYIGPKSSPYPSDPVMWGAGKRRRRGKLSRRR